MFKEITNCRKCNLCLNQLPLIDKKIKSEVMWVGLSAKKVENINKNYPLEENTISGKIIKEIEESLPNINFYKTNLVKCLPLDNNAKIRYPNNSEMNICIKNLITEIELLKPKIIFMLGNKVSDFIENYIKKEKININSNLIRIHHPSYISVYKKRNKQDYIDSILNDIKKRI